jgi:hypothetical protein
MSFLTAILGGLGGYTAGRQQRQQYNMQQQQYNQGEADRQRALGMDEAKYRDTARQLLADRGTDPNTARWNPATFQYEGGTPFQMPKGYQQAPTDPVQAAQHFQRLLSIYAAQNRADSPEANLALEGYKTAMTQVTEKQKFGQEIALKNLGYQYDVNLAGVRAAYTQQGREYDANQAMIREQMSEAHQDTMKNNDHVFDIFKLNYPSLNKMWEISSKGPAAQVQITAKAAQGNIDSLRNQINALSTANDKSKGLMPGQKGPVVNPNMDDFSTKIWKSYYQVAAHPERLKDALDYVKKREAIYNAGGVTTKDKQGNTVTDPGWSPSQGAAASNYLNLAAQTGQAQQAAQSNFKLLQQQAMSGQLGGGGGGSYDPRNPTQRQGALPPSDIWQMVVAAGGTPQEATRLTAIAMAESGGNPSQVNTHDPLGNGKFQHAWGLFQLGNGTNDPNAYPGWQDPQKNLQYALGKLRSQGWGAWGTYSTGAYKKFLPKGVSP